MENRVFSTAASKEISDTYVAVRLLGGDDITPEIERVMKLYDVRGYPTMLVVDQDGLRLNDQPVGRTTEGILAAMAAGKATGEKLAEAAKGEDQKAYLDLLKQHDGWEKLVGVFEKRTEAEPTAENHIALREALDRVGRTEDATKLLDTMIAKHTTHEKRPQWRIAKVMQVVASVNSRESAMELYPKAIEGIAALIAKADEEKDSATSLAAHLEMGNILLRTNGLFGRGTEARPHFDVVVEKGADTKYAAGALMGIANLHLGAKEYATALETLERVVEKYPDTEYAPGALMGIANVHFGAKEYEPALAALEKIVEKYPDSEEAKRAPMGIKRLKDMIGK